MIHFLFRSRILTGWSTHPFRSVSAGVCGIRKPTTTGSTRSRCSKTYSDVFTSSFAGAVGAKGRRRRRSCSRASGERLKKPPGGCADGQPHDVGSGRGICWSMRRAPMRSGDRSWHCGSGWAERAGRRKLPAMRTTSFCRGGSADEGPVHPRPLRFRFLPHERRHESEAALDHKRNVPRHGRSELHHR